MLVLCRIVIMGSDQLMKVCIFTNKSIQGPHNEFVGNVILSVAGSIGFTIEVFVLSKQYGKVSPSGSSEKEYSSVNPESE